MLRTQCFCFFGVYCISLATTSLMDTLNHSNLIFIFVDTPSGGQNGNPYDTSKLSTVLQLIVRRFFLKKP